MSSNYHTQIGDKLSTIESQHAELLETWTRRQEEFDHNLDVQMFHRDAEQAESWIALREAMLGNEDEDLGVIFVIHNTVSLCTYCCVSHINGVNLSMVIKSH